MRLLKFLVAIGLTALVAPAMAASNAPLDDQQKSEIMDFAMHDAMFTLYHEAGHMLIHEFHLPVLGKEEDAADALGVIEIVKNTPDGDELYDIMNDVADGWYYSSLHTTDEELAAFDDHSTDIQRANTMVCMMVGANPDEFTDTADDFGIDLDQQDACADTYNQALESWDTELQPHLAKRPGKRIPVVYEDAGKYARYRDELKSRKILENLAEMLRTSFALPDTVNIHAEQCDEANAFYEKDKHRIIYCYELAADMYRLGAANLFVDDEDQATNPEDSGDDVDASQTVTNVPRPSASSAPSPAAPASDTNVQPPATPSGNNSQSTRRDGTH